MEPTAQHIAEEKGLVVFSFPQALRMERHRNKAVGSRQARKPQEKHLTERLSEMRLPVILKKPDGLGQDAFVGADGHGPAKPGRPFPAIPAAVRGAVRGGRLRGQGFATGGTARPIKKFNSPPTSLTETGIGLPAKDALAGVAGTGKNEV